MFTRIDGSTWYRERIFGNKLRLTLGVSRAIGFAFAIQVVGVTFALWPFYAQISWNEWYHERKLMRVLKAGTGWQ